MATDLGLPSINSLCLEMASLSEGGSLTSDERLAAGDNGGGGGEGRKRERERVSCAKLDILPCGTEAP